MNTVRKSIVVALATLGLGGAAVAASDSGTAPAAGGCHWGAFGSHGANSAERMAKRQAALHDKLGLSTMQEAAWKTYTDKLQSLVPTAPAAAPAVATTAPERADRMVARCKPRNSGPRRGRRPSRNSMQFCHRSSRRSLTARRRVIVIIPVEAEVGCPGTAAKTSKRVRIASASLARQDNPCGAVSAV